MTQYERIEWVLCCKYKGKIPPFRHLEEVLIKDKRGKIVNSIHTRDHAIIADIVSKTVEKTNKIVKRIKNNIDKLKIGSCKKYQLRNKYELKEISDYCEEKDIKYEIVVDDKLTFNKLETIIPGEYCGYHCMDCYFCRAMYFKNVKVPCFYIKCVRPAKNVVK